MKSSQQISDTQLVQQHENKIPSSSKPKFLNQIMVKHRYAQKSVEKKKAAKQKNQGKIGSTFDIFFKSVIEIGEEDESQLQNKTVQINGNKIIGTWKKNQLHGRVIIHYSTGQYFQGVYQNGQRKQGLLRLAEGIQYQGCFKNELFHGKGTLIDNHKRKINCEWYENKPIDKVSIEYPSGDIYYGEVQKLKKHGQGHLFFKDGSKYIGKFTHGEITGYGTYYKDNQKIAEGLWQNGMLALEQNVYNILNQTIKAIKLQSDQPSTQLQRKSMHNIQKKNGRHAILELVNLGIF